MKTLPADATAAMDVLWNDPEEKRRSAAALAILKEQDPKKK